MLTPMSTEQIHTHKPVHPAAIGGAILAVVALLMVATGFQWAWVLGLGAVGVSAAAKMGGSVWTRVLTLIGVLGGILAAGMSFA